MGFLKLQCTQHHLVTSLSKDVSSALSGPVTLFTTNTRVQGSHTSGEVWAAMEGPPKALSFPEEARC